MRRIQRYLFALSMTVAMPCTVFAEEFQGSLLLGAPTATAIKLNILSPEQNGTLYVEYGTASGQYQNKSATAQMLPGQPLVVSMTGLLPDTRYYYRLQFQSSAEFASSPGDEYSFHTARPAGSTFTFTVQADSHLDENSDLAQYQQTLVNIRNDAADFHIDLGDTFMLEKHSEPFTTVQSMAADQATVNKRYAFERSNFGILSHSIPLFLVNGNHEGEWGWLANQTEPNIATWASKARHQYFLNPQPDEFYSGDTLEEPFIGQRAAWYSWQWGDALFVVLDPYWNTFSKGGKNPWALTLGTRQYQWLENTLQNSAAPFKFVFIHNLVGGLDGQMRGGIEAAPYFEWGGLNADGTDGFAKQRPDWELPVHPLLVRHGVTAVFHGHDHLYAKQELDGIIYQEVPQPSAKNFSNGPNLATAYHYSHGKILSSSGHLRVTVTPENAIGEYVRSWLPRNETATRKNAQVDDSWQVKSTSAVLPSAFFSYSPLAPTTEQMVEFHDDSVGNPISWRWQFSDGQSDYVQNPSHIFHVPGVYQVTLTVSNARGSHSASQTINVIDQTVPIIDKFQMPTSFNRQSIPITAFDASDNTQVAGYFVGKSAIPPLPAANVWLATRPSSYVVTGTGAKTVYAFVKDSAGNVSLPVMATVTIDRSAPVVSKFSIPARVDRLTIPINSLSAKDNIAVSGYWLGETAITPASDDAGWQSTAPTSYTVNTAGAKKLYLRVKDSAGNVSAAKIAKCVVTTLTP